MAAKKPRHLLRRLQVPLGVALQPEARLVDGAMLADAGEDILKRAAGRLVIEHVIGGDEGALADGRQSRETFLAGAVVGAAIRGEREEGHAGEIARQPAKMAFEPGAEIVGRHGDEAAAALEDGKIVEEKPALALRGAAVADGDSFVRRP